MTEHNAHEERQSAFHRVRAALSIKGIDYNSEERRLAVETLADCVAIPITEYKNYRKALWELLRSPRKETRQMEFLKEIGFLAPNHIGVGPEYSWTEKAHEFAREMDGK